MPGIHTVWKVQYQTLRKNNEQFSNNLLWLAQNLQNAKFTAMQNTKITISRVHDVQQLISGIYEMSMHQPKKIAGKGR